MLKMMHVYELFVGERTFDGKSRADIARMQSEQSPTSLSTVAADVDPAVERVILRCLEREPAARPSSALAVAAALPGGDPLAAALEAGETPDPAMVAAAGDVGGLRPVIAMASRPRCSFGSQPTALPRSARRSAKSGSMSRSSSFPTSATVSEMW